MNNNIEVNDNLLLNAKLGYLNSSYRKILKGIYKDYNLVSFNRSQPRSRKNLERLLKIGKLEKNLNKYIKEDILYILNELNLKEKSNELTDYLLNLVFKKNSIFNIINSIPVFKDGNNKIIDIKKFCNIIFSFDFGIRALHNEDKATLKENLKIIINHDVKYYFNTKVEFLSKYAKFQKNYIKGYSKSLSPKDLKEIFDYFEPFIKKSNNPIEIENINKFKSDLIFINTLCKKRQYIEKHWKKLMTKEDKKIFPLIKDILVEFLSFTYEDLILKTVEKKIPRKKKKQTQECPRKFYLESINKFKNLSLNEFETSFLGEVNNKPNIDMEQELKTGIKSLSIFLLKFGRKNKQYSEIIKTLMSDLKQVPAFIDKVPFIKNTPEDKKDLCYFAYYLNQYQFSLVSLETLSSPSFFKSDNFKHIESQIDIKKFIGKKYYDILNDIHNSLDNISPEDYKEQYKEMILELSNIGVEMDGKFSSKHSIDWDIFRDYINFYIYFGKKNETLKDVIDISNFCYNPIYEVPTNISLLEVFFINPLMSRAQYFKKMNLNFEDLDNAPEILRAKEQFEVFTKTLEAKYPLLANKKN